MRYREHRCPCDLPVQVMLRDGQSQPALIVNISPSGARLARLPRLIPGDRVFIALSLQLDLPEAEVRWSTDVYTGVRFLARLTPRAMAVVRQSVAHKSTTNPKGWNLQLREMR